MTAPSNFRKADVTRAIRAVQDAGLTVTEIRFLPQGGFEVLTSSAVGQSAFNEWDEDDEPTPPQTGRGK